MSRVEAVQTVLFVITIAAMIGTIYALATREPQHSSVLTIQPNCSPVLKQTEEKLGEGVAYALFLLCLPIPEPTPMISP